jgi:hypothetical protein
MCLEFDGQCCTSQVEDSLQLYLPSVFPKNQADASLADYWPALKKFGGTDNWPTHSMILPGNIVIENVIALYQCLLFSFQAMKLYSLWNQRPTAFELTKRPLGDSAVQLLDTSRWKLTMLFVCWKPNWHT